MISLHLGRACVLGGAVGLLVLSGCPGDDSGSDTLGATTQPGDTGMTSAAQDSSSGSTNVPSHEADIQPIWDEHCVTACHEPDGTGSFWIDLSAGEAYGAIVGVTSVSVSEEAFVEPGDPEGSYLWHKINGTQASVGGGGLDMPSPLAGMDDPTVLTQEQYDTIEAWIAGGAPE